MASYARSNTMIRERLPFVLLVEQEFQLSKPFLPEIIEVIDPFLQFIEAFLAQQAVAFSSYVLNVYKARFLQYFDMFRNGRPTHFKILRQRIDGHTVFR